MADNQTKIVITAVDQTATAFNSISANLGRLQGGLTSLGASLSVGAFVAWQKNLIDAADNMQDLSQRIGIGVRELAGYKLAAEQSGTSLEAVAKGVKSLSTYMVEHSDKLKAAGITAKDADTAMQQLADMFASMPDGINKTALATQLFGKAGMDMIPMLNQGAKGLADAKDAAKDYADQIAELAPKADKFNDSLAKLSLSAQGFGMKWAQPIVDGLNDIFDAYERGTLLRDTVGTSLDLAKHFLPGGSAISMAYDAWNMPDRGGYGTRSVSGKITGAVGGAANPDILLDKSTKAKKGVDELARATDAWLKSVGDVAEGIDKQIASAQKELDTFGLSREALAAYTAQQTEKLALDREHEAQTLRTAAAHAGPLHDAYMQAANDLDLQAQKLRKVSDLQKQLASKETIAANLDTINDKLAAAIKDGDEEWKKWEAERQKSADQIGEALAQSLMQGGKSAGEYLKRYFATLVLQPMIQGMMAPISGAISGALYGSGPNSGGLLNGGGSGGAMGLVSAGSSLYSAVSGAGSALGAGYYGLATSGAGQFLGLSSAANFVGPSAVGSAVGATGAAEVGLTSLGSTIGTALPYIAAALALYSLFSSGGGEDPHNNPDARYLVGRLGKGGLTAAGGNLAHITMGQTSGQGRWAEYSAMSEEEIAQIEKMGAAVFDAGRNLAQILGVDAAALDDVSVEGERFKDAADMVGKLSDAVALKLIPNLADFQQASESLSQAAQRVVADITALDAIARAQGKTFGASGVADRASYAEKIVGGAGGSGALNSYYANYFSEDERMALTSQTLAEQFKALGVEMPDTEAGFRDLVGSLMDGGDATATLTGQVLGLGDAFFTVAEFAKKKTQELLGVAGGGFVRDGLTVGFTTLADGMLGLPSLTAHANGGLASGWSLVGERGPELVNFSQPGRVYTADQTRQALGGGSDGALRAVLSEVAKSTKATHDLLRRVTRDGNALVTTT